MSFTLGLQRRSEASGCPNLKPVEGKKPWTNRGPVTVEHTYSDGDLSHEQTGAAWRTTSFDVQEREVAPFRGCSSPVSAIANASRRTANSSPRTTP